MPKENSHLMTIGQAAKALGVTRRMILNYEDKGLLKPDKKDGKTGNRYYTADSVSRILTIRSLQNLGLSLDEIRAYYEGTTDIVPLITRLEQMRDALNLYIEKLKMRVQTEGDMIVELVTLPKQVIYRDIQYAQTTPERAQKLREAFVYALRNFCADTSKRTLFIESSLEEPTLISNCVVLSPDTPLSEHIISLPEEKALAVIHHGSYETIPMVVEKLVAHAKTNQIPIKGTYRRIFIEGPPQHNDPSKFITQVALLIETNDN